MELKELRIRNELTIAEMAKIVGKAPSTWRGYENGKISVPAGVYEKLCAYFGVDDLKNALPPQIKNLPKEGQISRCEMLIMQYLWSVPSATFQDIFAAYPEPSTISTINKYLSRLVAKGYASKYGTTGKRTYYAAMSKNEYAWQWLGELYEGEDILKCLGNNTFARMKKNKLRKLRVSYKLKTAEMAKIVGKSPGSWSNYENGKIPVPDEVYEKLKEYFGEEEFEKKTTGPEGLISKGEMLAMQFLWSRPSAAFKEIKDAYPETVAKQTVNTHLIRLIEKGYVSSEGGMGRKTYYADMSKSEYAWLWLEEMYEGSRKQILKKLRKATRE